MAAQISLRDLTISNYSAHLIGNEFEHLLVWILTPNRINYASNSDSNQWILFIDNSVTVMNLMLILFFRENLMLILVDQASIINLFFLRKESINNYTIICLIDFFFYWYKLVFFYKFWFFTFLIFFIFYLKKEILILNKIILILIKIICIDILHSNVVLPPVSNIRKDSFLRFIE